MQAAQLRQQQSIGWKGRWGGPRLFLKECQRNKQIWHHWKNHSTSWSSVYWLSRPSTVSLDKKYSYINNHCTFFLITMFPLSDPVSLNNLICIIIAGVCHCDITWIICSAISLKYARIWKGQKLYNEPYPLIITNPRFVQDLKCVLPILSLVEQWRAAAICHPCRGTSWTTILYQQAPHYYHFAINASHSFWPGEWKVEVTWQGPEVAHDHQEVHGQLPPASREGRRG